MSRNTREACLELVERRSVVSHSLYRWQFSGVANERIQTNEVLARDQKRLTDLKVEGDAKDPEALSAEIVEGIRGAVQGVKYVEMLVCSVENEPDGPIRSSEAALNLEPRAVGVRK